MRNRLLFLSLMLSMLWVVPNVQAEMPEEYKALYQSCVDEYDTFNNSVLADCSLRVSDEVNAKIAVLYNKIHQTLSADLPEDAADFAKAHQAWLEYKEQQCRLAASYIGSPMYFYCPMNKEVERLQELQELAEQFW